VTTFTDGSQYDSEFINDSEQIIREAEEKAQQRVAEEEAERTRLFEEAELAKNKEKVEADRIS